MERIDVIAQAAARLRAQYLSEQEGQEFQKAGSLVRGLCEALEIDLIAVSPLDSRLGGTAYARFQLWEGETDRGAIWLRHDLPSEKGAFAIAHELGHFILHRGEGQIIHGPCNEHQVNEQDDSSSLRVIEHRVEEYTPRARRELEANTFAAELLAPCTEVRFLFATMPDCDAGWLAEHFGISLVLAQQRLIDAVLSNRGTTTAERSKQPADLSNQQREPIHAADLLRQLDESQREAARAVGPALVIAGPGTGKTATLVGRVAHLLSERALQPEQVLALTFSNRAAGEMRERLARHGLPGERMPVMTIHAFAANLLREYASYVPYREGELPLSPAFRILDPSDAYLLMEELLGELPLHYYRSLSNPTQHFSALLSDFSHARDQLLTPDAYLELVATMPISGGDVAGTEEEDSSTTDQPGPGTRPTLPPGTFTREQIARARERALAYGVWDQALRRRGLVDFGGLIQRAVELLRANAQVLAEVRRRYLKVLVDEFQDTNRAAAELILLAAGDPRQELWVVGDRNQSIYRWRGASPQNLKRLTEHVPSLKVYTLRRCYRSVPSIVRLGSHIAERMAARASGNEHQETAKQDQPGLLLRQALQPIQLEANRQEQAHPAVMHGEFLNDLHERLGLAAAIRRFHAQQFKYSDQAILCRSHKQAYRIAAVLTAEGIPVRQVGDFFERPEVKDALALVSLAAGPDARGLLRARALLAGIGYPAATNQEIAALVRALATQHKTLPGALTDTDTLAGVAALTPGTRSALRALGAIAEKFNRNTPDATSTESHLGQALAAFLLAPGGYAWQLIRTAHGIQSPPASSRSSKTIQALNTPGNAQAALAALGELVRLAARFDTRWNTEPDFRARLGQAVAHWYGQPAVSETSGPLKAPGDTSPSLEEQAQGINTSGARGLPQNDSEQAALPMAPPVRCFLHYLDALRAADVAVPVPVPEEDAVHILTLHASKGLEFPIVYMPELAQGRFPPQANHREEASPVGFRENDAPGEQETEERCLFYVGVTRARDVIALTRATRYGKQKKPPSSLWELVEAIREAEPFAPLLSNEEVEMLAVRVGTTGRLELEDESETEEELPHERAARQGKRSYRLSELEQYLACPRQYKYARTYAMLDPAQNVVYRFHRYVRRGLHMLREVQSTMPEASWSNLEPWLRALWEAEGPVGHAYDRYFWRHARDILRHEWNKLTGASVVSAKPNYSLAEELHVELAHCMVRVTADRVARANATPGAGNTETTILSRLHTSRPRQTHMEDLRLPLYYLGHQQQHPNTPIRIELAYLGDVLADVAPLSGYPLQSDAVDVTKEARKIAEDYRKAGRKARSRLDKLDEAARGIEALHFEPHPDERRCAECPYFYVCPSDPEAEE